MASVFFRLDGAFLTGCTWGYDRLHPPHLARGQAHLDAVRVRRRVLEQLRDHAPRELSGGLILLLNDVHGHARLNLRTKGRHALSLAGRVNPTV